LSYQVLARKWRPRRFDEVVGQKGVTQTLRNALVTGRIAQAFVFAGARGVGKTTTARILARALNCENGPTPDPCGTCEMCIEIGEGRDLDVLEIDAATHTGVDNVREVIIDGLQIRPARDRYKIFIIDEVHQLSGSSFNALLKSMEEPPPHVVFMMATTELHKIPETILSRAQVFELRTIGTQAIAAQLRRIADAEGVAISDEAIALIARAGDGSMRDAQSALDQVLAFGAGSIDAAQVAEVLGLVDRDLLLDLVDVIAREDAPRVFDIAGRLVESGHDLRHVCRELGRLLRDLMVLQVDPDRVKDPAFAVEGDVERLRALAAAFSREDLLRGFEVVAKLEADVRFAPQPRYYLEMALLRWVHLRRLVPLSNVIDSLQQGTPLPAVGRGAPVQPVSGASKASGGRSEPAPTRPASPPVPPRPDPSAKSSAAAAPSRPQPSPTAESPAQPPSAIPTGLLATDTSEGARARFRDAFMAEVKRTQTAAVWNMVFASARRVDVMPGKVTFVYESLPKTLLAQFDQLRPQFEELATRIAGRPTAIASQTDASAEPPKAQAAESNRERLKVEALNEPAVQALLDVFPADIRDVEEVKNK
jgi:DNA polymerase-3 subunit gamma/tau